MSNALNWFNALSNVVASLNSSHWGWGGFEKCKASMCYCWRLVSECEKVRNTHGFETSPIFGEVSIWENLARMCVYVKKL